MAAYYTNIVTVFILFLKPEGSDRDFYLVRNRIYDY